MEDNNITTLSAKLAEQTAICDKLKAEAYEIAKKIQDMKNEGEEELKKCDAYTRMKAFTKAYAELILPYKECSEKPEFIIKLAELGEFIVKTTEELYKSTEESRNKMKILENKVNEYAIKIMVLQSITDIAIKEKKRLEDELKSLHDGAQPQL